MSENLTDEDFIVSARTEFALTTMNTLTGAYLDEALQRLDRANALIDDIKAQVSCGGVKHVGRIYSMIEDRYKT